MVGLSAVLIVASFALVAVRGLNLGIDFTGGVVVETNFPQPPNIEQLRTALAKAGISEAQVQAFGSSRDILVRLPPDPSAKGAEIGARILDVFKSADAGASGCCSPTISGWCATGWSCCSACCPGSRSWGRRATARRP